MLDERFNILALIIALIGGGSYLIDTLKGRIQPNKVSWFLWIIAPTVAFLAEIKQDVGLPSLLTFAAGFIPLLVFISSFVNKKSYWKIEKFDLACGALSILGLILWQTTQIGNLAIIFSIIADAMAAMPTIAKSYKEPESESSFAFFAFFISSIITLLTISNWTFANYGFPIYLLFLDGVIFVLIKFKLGRKI